MCQRGDVLNARYEVVAVLDDGHYARVVECMDHEAGGRHVAVKIAKDLDWSSDAAREEIQVLEDLKASDPSNAYHCVQMLGWFEYHGHVCIVFELLGLSTFDFMSNNDFSPFSLDDIRHMAYQICTSVNFLHMKKLTHTDLKTDNIVYVNSDYVEEYNPKLRRKERRLRNPDIKVVDFGCATYDHKYHKPSVTARAYRAPEVVLELGWSHPCDVWSIGCILLEYYRGVLVFEPDDDIEHLAMMERLLGPLPDHMIKRVVSSRKKKYFRKGRLAWDERSASGQYVSGCCKPLKEYMTCHDSDHENLFDLIGKMLEYDPATRITLEEALEHPFFLPLKQEKRACPPTSEAGKCLCLPDKRKLC
ncbi:dual specificity protein kinase CLK1-like [Cuculus canorus]|uniref:dual specificity protein kinase CLK1-like n=1 Tax=Cuculus canorus TaxID=55661 RepID=UPI0023AA48AF|nr:dual specificity protein kinase CLK1-like [Cuculus canorus]XP_053925819.1 dual specificity protein kinase CLK1-like [Cuculus canorus]